MLSHLADFICTLRKCLLRAMAIVLAVTLSTSLAQAQEGLALPAPERDVMSAAGGMQTAVFAGGCFWGVQAVFQHVTGVTNAVSGYAGGAEETATYEKVGRGTTGHAEAVRITYDPAKVSYGDLLHIFFSAAHDPTQLNRQGPDTGSQYRTAIFPQTEGQAAVAQAYIAQLNATRLFDAAIVTTVEPRQSFYPAEDYHQDYLVNNPTQPYIIRNDMPKLDHLKAQFPSSWRDAPVLVADVGVGG